MPDARPMMTSHVVPIAKTVLRCWQDAFAPYCSAVRSRHNARNIAMAGKNRSRRGETLGRNLWQFYSMTPQAMRPPASPVGSVL
jgi:hypothetical protein